MNKWIGKVALVTGASSGIGQAIATKLTENGMKVVGCARNLEKLDKIAFNVNQVGKGEMFPYKCDLKKEDEILGMFKFIKEKFGTIHVCINNAGLAHISPLLSGKTSDWKDVFDINVFALSIGTREAVALMRSSGVDDGHIININSICGHKVFVGNPMYCASKYAVTALTEGLRLELHELNSHIRATSISPGLVETDFSFRKHKDNPQKAVEAYSRIKCLQSDDIADAVCFALSAPLHMDVNEMIISPTEK